jgi:hypothetical protein
VFRLDCCQISPLATIKIQGCWNCIRFFNNKISPLNFFPLIKTSFAKLEPMKSDGVENVFGYETSHSQVSTYQERKIIISVLML